MNNSQQHVVWIDYLRIIACLMMVLAHSCDPFVGQFGANDTEFLTGTWFGSCLRSAVPLFVMVSGVLLLPVKIEMGAFYRRRLSRVVFPLIVWSVITPIVYTIYMNNVGTINPLQDASSYTWSSAVDKIVYFPISFNYDTTPLWYLYMLVGLYLFMPIISPWLKESSAKTIRVFLYIWGFTLFIPYISILSSFVAQSDFAFGTMGLFGVCDWNPYGMFYYFSGFLGYIVLAYYLREYPLKWSVSKSVMICVPLFIVGAIITAVGFLQIQSYFPGQYPMLEKIWFFNSFNVALMTFAVFVLIQKINWRPSAFVATVANLTFGIYLTHFFVVQVAYDFIYSLAIPAYAQVLAIALSAFIASGVVVYVIQKLPKSKYIVG